MPIFKKCKITPRNNLSGKLFGRWSVIKPAGKTKQGDIIYQCVCSCGTISFVYAKHLSIGFSKSCGCLGKENRIKALTKHGMCGTKIYRIWEDMNHRCHKKYASNYDRYGGRGISVCDRWRRSFENFYKDMGDPPAGKQLDRKENDQDYSKTNCKWSTPRENCSNTRRNVYLIYNGEKKCLSEWSRETGIPARTLSYRNKKGLSAEQILGKTEFAWEVKVESTAKK